MPTLGSAKWGRAANARRGSVRKGMLPARAEAPAAKRKKVRREKPLQSTGPSAVCMNSTPLEVADVGRMAAAELRARRGGEEHWERERGRRTSHNPRYPWMSVNTRKNARFAYEFLISLEVFRRFWFESSPRRIK